MNNVRREISILKKINHPNIMKLYYVIEDKRQVIFLFKNINKHNVLLIIKWWLKKINLITEFAGTISLQKYLRQRSGRRVDENEGKRIFK